MKLFCAFAVATLLLCGTSWVTVQEEGEQAEEATYTISQVMKQAHMGKDALMKRVAAGEANEAETRKLLKMYVNLVDAEPPRGEQEEWKAATSQLVVAAARAVVGDPQAEEALKSATNCKACHDRFKD